MTPSLATCMAALLKRARRAASAFEATSAPAPDAAHISLATLNQARRTTPHPATPAYRLRHPGSRPARPVAARTAWPFRADAP